MILLTIAVLKREKGIGSSGGSVLWYVSSLELLTSMVALVVVVFCGTPYHYSIVHKKET